MLRLEHDDMLVSDGLSDGELVCISPMQTVVEGMLVNRSGNRPRHMHKLIHWFVHNSVAANLLMMILVVGGLLALPRIHQEEFPTLDVDAVSVRVPYLGAAPTEVESAVCAPCGRGC